MKIIKRYFWKERVYYKYYKQKWYSYWLFGFIPLYFEEEMKFDWESYEKDKN